MLAIFRYTLPAAVAAALAPMPCAQGTTGIPGINDYTISGSVSGAASCQTLSFPNGSTQTFVISSAPGVAVLYLFSLSPNCPCLPCALPFLPQPCPNPLNPSCPVPTNTSLDLLVPAGCPVVAVGGTTLTTGISVLTLTLPSAPGYTFATQGVVAAPCSAPFIFTQGYQIVLS